MAHPEEEDVEQDRLLATGAGGVEMQQLPEPHTDAVPPLRTPSVPDLSSSCSSSSTKAPAPACDASRQSLESAASSQCKEPALCRICFEEDTAANLVHPCACTGTQKFAHHACIQRWVQEKGHLRCEVCAQEYSAALSFEVPPPPPPAPVGETIMHPLFGPILIRVDADGAAHQRASALELYDEQEHYQQRHPGTTWCFTFILFIMFLVVMHHSVLFSEDEDDGVDAGGVPTPGDPGGGGGAAGSGGDDYSPSFAVFLLWVASKALMIGIPLYVVMKIAARQAQREQYEAMMGAGQMVGEPGGRMVLHVRAAPHTGPNAV